MRVRVRVRVRVGVAVRVGVRIRVRVEVRVLGCRGREGVGAARALLICSSVPFLKRGWSMRRRTYWRVAGALALASSASCLG